MLCAPFSKKRTQNLGSIFVQKNDVLEGVVVGVWSTEEGVSEVLLRARVLCCAGASPGMRSWRSMVQVAANMKTNRVGAAARQS